MSKARTITFRLTEEQYDALCGAVAFQDSELEERLFCGDSAAAREGAVLDRAWSALSGAWHAKARGGDDDTP